MTPEQAALPYRPCVGIVLANDGGRIFGGERLDTPGAWQMPQGGIDEGESPRSAALRELLEETGIAKDLVRIEAKSRDWLTYDLPDDLVGKVWKGKFRGQKQLWYLMRYHGRDDQIDIATEHAEFGRWQWMAPDAVIASIVPFKRDLYKKVIGQFRDQL